jgi:glycosyltransferase involved in cell wall biosynthesis
MPNLVIQLHAGEYQDFVARMEETGFERLVLGAKGGRFMSKRQLLLQYLSGTFRLLLAARKLRNLDTVIVFGHFAYAVKLLARLRVLRYRRSLCFAFFVHSPRLFTLVRFLRRLDRANDHYVIFSRSEVDLYAERLGIDRRRMHYQAYGEWGSIAGGSILKECGGYYFAGGYSNRDHRSLVEVFRELDAKLVIVCSRLNRDLDGVSLPPNVSVYYDLPRAEFEAYAQGAKAGIVSLKHDTGASGQSVLLILMRHGKCIIANNAGSIRDYIAPGVSGILLDDLPRQLRAAILRIEEEPIIAERIGQAARRKYEAHFSPAAALEAFQELLRAA